MTNSKPGRNEPGSISIDEKIGFNLRRLRKAAGLTQAELGDRVGVRFQQIQKYETGANRIHASRLKQLADALEVSVIALYGDDGDSALGKSALRPPPSLTLEEAQNLLIEVGQLDRQDEELVRQLIATLARKSKRSA